MKLMIQVYKTDGAHETFEYSDLEKAKRFADEEFKKSNVYKVKIWNGPAVPNVANHPNLVYHLV